MQFGKECLAEWLRTKRALHALDAFNDNLYVFRCLAVHRGVNVQHNLQQTRELAEDFFAAHVILDEKLMVEHLPLVASLLLDRGRVQAVRYPYPLPTVCARRGADHRWQEPIKWSLHLPYKPLESTLSRVDL